MQIVEVEQIPTKELMKPVPFDNPDEVHRVCEELKLLCEQQRGIGVSAVQVGIPWNLFLVRGDGSCPLVPKNEFRAFVECSYKKATEETVDSLEGCLSLRSPSGLLRFFHVERAKHILISGYCFSFNNFVKLENYPLDVEQQGIVFQHEIDHSFQILISEICKKEIFNPSTW